jgi:hypothetical protein
VVGACRERVDEIEPRLLGRGQAKRARLIGGRESGLFAVIVERDLSQRQPVFRAPGRFRLGADTGALAPHVRTRQWRHRHRAERVAQRQIEQHLLVVVRIDDNDLGRRLTDRGHRGLALCDVDRAELVGKLHQPFQHDQ